MPGSTATQQTAHRKPVDYEHDDRPSQEAIRQGHLSLVPPPAPYDLEALLVRLSHLAPRRVWLAAALRRDGRGARRLAQFKGLSALKGVPLLATMDATHCCTAQQPLQAGDGKATLGASGWQE